MIKIIQLIKKDIYEMLINYSCSHDNEQTDVWRQNIL